MIFRPSIILAVAMASAAPALIGASDNDARALFKTGMTQFNAGDLDGARNQFRQAALADENWSDPHVMLGRISLMRRNGANALGEFDRAVALGMAANQAAPFRADAQQLMGNYDGALTTADPANIAPNQAAYAARVRSRAFSGLRKRDAAARELDLAGRLDQNSADLWITAAHFRLDGGDFSGAIQAAEKAVAVAPNDPVAMLLAANFMRDRYGMTAALPWYDHVLELDPGNRDAQVDRAATMIDAGESGDGLAAARALYDRDKKDAMAYYLQAVVAARGGEWDVAKSLIYRTGGRLDGLPGMAVLKAAIELHAGTTETAIAVLKPVVEENPDNRHAVRLLGLGLYKVGDFSGAVDTLKPLVAKGDGWSIALSARASEQLDDREAAAQLRDFGVLPPRPEAVPFATAIANIRFNSTTAVRLINALAAAGSFDKAAAVRDTWRAAYPVDLAAMRLAERDGLAAGYADISIPLAEAIRARGAGEDAQLLDDLAWARDRAGDSAAALRHARHAYAIAPGSPVAAATYGWFLAKSGNKPRGLAMIEKAMLIDPGYRPFRDRLAAARAL